MKELAAFMEGNRNERINALKAEVEELRALVLKIEAQDFKLDDELRVEINENLVNKATLKRVVAEEVKAQLRLGFRNNSDEIKSVRWAK